LKKLFSCCLLLWLSACVPLLDSINETTQKIPADQQLFLDGVEQFSQQREASTLRLLQDRFPSSPWTSKAAAILSLIDQINGQEQQLAQLQSQLAQQQQQLAKHANHSTDQELEEHIKRCQSDNQRLKEELSVSRRQLEALRELTIELELKEP
jgi:septal ring factor EnvC (AmiA/AmiB activator)